MRLQIKYGDLYSRSETRSKPKSGGFLTKTAPFSQTVQFTAKNGLLCNTGLVFTLRNRLAPKAVSKAAGRLIIRGS